MGKTRNAVKSTFLVFPFFSSEIFFDRHLSMLILDTLKQIDKLGMAEDLETVKQRMQNELKTVAKKTAKAGGGNILIISHGMSILTMISDMTDKEPEGGQLANSSVTKITYKNGEFEVNEVENMEYVESSESEAY